MFNTLKRNLGDMRTLRILCEGAERHARLDGDSQPAAEHFLLAAFDLPDGAAKRAPTRTPSRERWSSSIASRWPVSASIRRFGTPSIRRYPPPQSGLYRAAPSGQMLMQQLASQRRGKDRAALNGAHVVEALLALELGSTVRALNVLGIRPDALAEAARRET